jgi:hypothetical protein
VTGAPYNTPSTRRIARWKRLTDVLHYAGIVALLGGSAWYCFAAAPLSVWLAGFSVSALCHAGVIRIYDHIDALQDAVIAGLRSDIEALENGTWRP